MVLEGGRIGHGASGRTGGMALDGAAADDLSGLEDVLGGLRKILGRLEVECDLSLPGAWEIARRGGPNQSPIAWNDSGTLRVVNEVPGGTLDPGKLVSGLARAGDRLGAMIAENHPAERVEWDSEAEIHFAGGRLRARKVLLATNGLSLRLSGMGESTMPKLTLAALSSPLSEKQLEEIGLAQRKPFYTVDFPYLWGRVCNDNSLVLGAGLLDAPESDDLEDVDIAAPNATRMFRSFERRMHGLHPALKECRFTHHWGGPILFREGWRPVFAEHPASAKGIVLGAYAGHGVALSSFLGAWAAEALLGKRSLPEWGALTARRVFR